MIFTTNEKTFLSQLGRTEQGRDLILILERVKKEMSSIDSIESGKDYGAQVEGRKLFKNFVEEVVKEIKTQKQPLRPIERDDFS